MPLYRCALEASMGSALYVNVWYIEAVTGQASAIGTAWVNQVSTPYVNCLHSSITLDQMVVTEVSANTQVTTLINTPGTQTTEMSAPQNAAVISWRTMYIGKSARGRTYVFGLPEGAQNAGIITNSQLALLAALASALRVAWPAAFGGKLVLFHRITGGYTDIMSSIVRDVVYTQRRRTLGVGA